MPVNKNKKTSAKTTKKRAPIVVEEVRGEVVLTGEVDNSGTGGNGGVDLSPGTRRAATNVKKRVESQRPEILEEEKTFWEETAKDQNAKKDEVEKEPEEIDFLREGFLGADGSQGARRSKFFWTVFVTALVVGFLGAGILIFRGEIVKVLPGGVIQTPTPSPEPEQTPTPIPVPDRNNLTVQVLNGSGAPGIGKKAQDYLEGLGYKVEDIGNAKSFNYKETEISVKENKKEYLELLISDLSKVYKVSETSKILPGESKFDAVVIIGKEK